MESVAGASSYVLKYAKSSISEARYGKVANLSVCFWGGERNIKNPVAKF